MSVMVVHFTPGMKLPESLYVDSNVLVAFIDRHHPHHSQAGRLLIEAMTVGSNIYISTLVLDEVWYVLMRCWHKQELGINLDSKKKEHIQWYGTGVEPLTHDMLRLLKATLLPLPGQNASSIMECALRFLVEEHLGPRDCYIDQVIKSSRQTRKGGQITEGKRALEKKIGHAKATGYKSAFEGIPFTQENAEKLIRDILVNPNRTFMGDKVIDAYDTMGRGVRFDRITGNFIGFLEEALAKP